MKELNNAICPDDKLKVFISSRCEGRKYKSVRKKIKNLLQASDLMSVYLFEDQGASTLNADEHYLSNLRDSDVCIFLIDNKDDVSEGVLKEIDAAKKYKIKSLFYFCDSRSKKETAVQKSLTGDKFSKYKIVHSFNEIIEDSARDLINDIVTIYHLYCKDYLNDSNLTDHEGKDILQIYNFDSEENSYLFAPKTVLKQLYKSKGYIQIFTTGQFVSGENKDSINQLDEWCFRFLQVMFEDKSMNDFNVDMFLDDSKSFKMNENYSKIVRQRWKAVEAYFLGNVEKSVSELDKALKLAKNEKAPSWVINDILIDLRNQNILLCEISGSYSYNNPEYQEEINQMDESVYYPLLDRVEDSLHDTYIDEFSTIRLESPYTVKFGGSKVDICSEYLASDLIISMINGSLTHIRSFYKEIEKFLFYLCTKYSNWTFRRDMLKMSLYNCDGSEVENIIRAYPEILNNLDSEDANEILTFCNRNHIEYRRFISTLMGFGVTGYYLTDDEFKWWSDKIVEEIKENINVSEPNRSIGQCVFKSLTNVKERISQDMLSEICCLVMKQGQRCFYENMFDIINEGISLDQMSRASAQNLIECLIKIIESPTDRELLKRKQHCLVSLRVQNKKITKNLDLAIQKYMPDFYDSDYKLDTTEDKNKDMPAFVAKYIQSIHQSNVTQGLNGVYSVRFSGDIQTVYNIIKQTDVKFTDELIDSLIEAVSETLLKSKEGIRIRLDAINLLILIIIRYPDSLKRNDIIFNEVYNDAEKIEDTGDYGFPTNINNIAIKIDLQFLYLEMGYDTYVDLVNLMPLLHEDATIIAVAQIIDEYLQMSNSLQLPKYVDSLVLQYAIQWLQADLLDIRFPATSILLSLLRNEENADIINTQLIRLVDSDNYYIKNLILRNVFKINNISKDTREYILLKCKNDPNYLVREVYQEECRNYE